MPSTIYELQQNLAPHNIKFKMFAFNFFKISIKEAGYMIYHQKESPSVATDPEFTEMVKLANNKFQTLLHFIYF